MKKLLLIINFLCFLLLPAAVGAADQIRVTQFVYNPSGNENYNANGEFVILENISEKDLNLSGWKILDASKHKLILPDMIIQPNMKLKIYSGTGSNKLGNSKNTQKVYWGNGSAIWNNDGDILTVKDRKNNIILKYKYE